ncbi:MAG TPA: NAD+ synthase [Acidimicrobiia bacterium]|nr:NAD+ synthase [Acidimicrobiia bacterium]
MRIAGAQVNLRVGDLDGNEKLIADCMTWAEGEAADVLLLPELAVTGYPPEDLVLRMAFVEDNLDVIRRLAARSARCTTVVGFVDLGSGAIGRGGADAARRNIYNAAAILQGGEWRATYHKILLPNYGVFDEDRYFLVGQKPDFLWDIGGVPAGISICEDIWVPDGPPLTQARAGARILLNINGSPYHYGKAHQREEMLAERAKASGVPVVYLNLVGGQDELVFDGCSVVIDRSGAVVHRSPQFAEDRFVLDLDDELDGRGTLAPLLDAEEEVYRALQLGLTDYVRRNGFDRVVIGLSGGIDSALTAAIATDALGSEGVWGVAMPTKFSSDHSVSDAVELAKRLGIQFDVVPIQSVFDDYLDALAPLFGDEPFGVAEENLQARIRGAVLMAISNRFGPMVVATGNKSEMAVGYSTIYGDMVGGFSVLKDVFKTTVYDLARWRNRESEVIPSNSIDKPPSAELRPNQKDSDSLPPYEELDPILRLYIEDDRGVEDIIAAGHDPETVRRITRLVDRNEYKRRQAAPGVKITTKAFGRDRRLPITNGYR